MDEPIRSQFNPEQLQQSIEQLARFAEAARDLAAALAKVIHDITARLVELWISIKRACFHHRLISWGIPARLAQLISQRWPARWLPAPQLE